MARLLLLELNVLPLREQASVQKARADIATLEQALDAYRLDMRRYPTVEEGLDALVNALREETHLFKVSSNVTRQMRGENRQENWLCNIRPVQVEDGLALHAFSAVVLQFNRDGYEYFAVIRQLY